jgi:outer membrane protein assembly factor BamD (BamD/ComL family)
MVKRRRPQPAPVKTPVKLRPLQRSKRVRSKPPAPALAAEATPQTRRSTYIEAVGLYERGLEALQRHDYSAAAEFFESILRQHPEERELHERVRAYLVFCRRHLTTLEATPTTLEERLYASTLAINSGQYDQAISHLRLVRDEDPDSDHALYMLAVAHAQRGEHAVAVAHLVRAIALNRENRTRAKSDPDLWPLRRDEAFRAALDLPLDARRPLGPRTVR